MGKRVALLFLWCFAGPTLLAQDKKGKPATVRFVAQIVPEDSGQVVMRFEEKESEPFDLPMNNLTYEMKAPARAFKLAIAGTERAIGVVKLPAEGRSFIVLLLAKEKGGYKSVVLPAEDASFRPGDVYLHNTSRVPVMGKIGDRSFVLSPGKGRIHSPSGAVDDTYYDVAFAIKDESGETRYLSTSRWPATERTRSYVIFYKDPTTDRIRFRSVDEFIPLGE